MDCLFCKIIKGEIKSKKLYEDDKVMVILDAYPNCDGHTLIIPKEHYEDFTKVPDDLLLHINSVSKNITKLIQEKMNPKSFTYIVNYLEGQAIKHYHYHILPNYHIKPVKTTKEIYNILIK